MKDPRFAWMFPDTLYLHGERGNISAIDKYCKECGIKTTWDRIDLDNEDFDPEAYDVLFFPPGEISSFPVIIDAMRPYKDRLVRRIESGKPMLVTGTTVAMFCDHISRTDGSEISGIGILSAISVEKESVYGDDIYFETEFGGTKNEVIGAQIQMTDFTNSGEKPFGRIIYGYGNNGKTREEGFIKNNSIFTNALGPMFALNPWMIDKFIAAALPGEQLPAVDSVENIEFQRNAFEQKKEDILTKKTDLTNHLN